MTRKKMTKKIILIRKLKDYLQNFKIINISIFYYILVNNLLHLKKKLFNEINSRFYYHNNKYLISSKTFHIKSKKCQKTNTIVRLVYGEKVKY